MIANGALEEARAELPDWRPSRPASRAIGAPELIAHLRGELPLAQAIAAAKIASRQYAKRQYTWFTNQPPAHWSREMREIDNKIIDELAIILQR